MVFAMLICVTICLLLLVHLWNSKRFSTNSIPCPRFYPVVGHIPILFSLNYKKYAEIGYQCSGVYSLYIWNKEFVMINSWNGMREVLHSDVFTGRPRTSFMEQIMKQSFVFGDGPIWKEKKRFTMHVFKNLGFGKSRMEQIFHNEISKIVKVMDEHDGTKLMVMNDLFLMAFFNVIWDVIAGKTFAYNDEQIKRIYSIIIIDTKLSRRLTPLIVFPLLQYIPGDPFSVALVTFYKNELNKFFIESIEKHIEDGTEQPQDYIGFYLAEISRRKDRKSESDECYTRQHLLGSLHDILHGGLETALVTMEWALIYMCMWPEIQKKVQDELDTILGRNCLPTFSDQTKLPYTRATIREIQRFCTVIPMSAPRQVHSTTTLMGYTIPAESFILLNYWAINNEKETWGDPEVFRPERFLDENGKLIKMEHFIPFSRGGRACIGESLAQMELFLCFTCLMQRYSFSYATGEAPPSLTSKISIINSPLPFHPVIKRR